jgi:hypothetical protein
MRKPVMLSGAKHLYLEFTGWSIVAKILRPFACLGMSDFAQVLQKDSE